MSEADHASPRRTPRLSAWLLRSSGLWFAYGYYAVCALLSLVFVLRFVTETKGVELEDMA